MPHAVEVDSDICICSRECVRVAPDAFEIDEDEMVSKPTATAADADPAVLHQAVSACPVGAISVRR